jgi:PPOX class probable F420-dependent enzyme
MTPLTDKVKEICAKQTFVHSATLMADGSPHVTPTWVDVEGDRIVLNSEKKRVKPRNVERDPRIALSATDPDDAYSAFFIRGRVVEVTEEGAFEQADRLAKKYMGVDEYPLHQPGDVRVKIYVEADSIGEMP